MPGYKLSVEAERDLEGIYLTGLLEFGARQADLYFEGLVPRFDQIASTPMMYADVSHLRAGYRRSVYNAHAIYYQIAPAHVFVVRILKRQNPTAL